MAWEGISMSEREYDLLDYFKNALDKIEGGSTNIFLLKQDLERIIEWKTERDTFKEQLEHRELVDPVIVKHWKDRAEAAESRVAEADLQGKVRDFHLKFNFTANPTNENPTLIPIELARRRFWLLLKEVDELEEAMEAEDLIKIANAIGDILYFVYGDAVAYGIPVIPVFNEIHRSNMTKSPCLDKDVRAVKGLNYSPPNLEKALRGVVGESEEEEKGG